MRMALDQAEEKLNAKLLEVSEIKKTINGMLAIIGEAPRYTDVEIPQRGGPSASVRRDEFFGKSPVTAAREFLDKVKQPSTAEEILEGLKKGGFDFEGQNWREEARLRNLAISLGKNTQIFIRLPSDAFGLVKWYPELKAKKKAAAVTSAEPVTTERAPSSPGALSDETSEDGAGQDAAGK